MRNINYSPAHTVSFPVNKLWDAIFILILLINGLATAFHVSGPVKMFLVPVELLLIPAAILLGGSGVTIRALLTFGFLGIDYPLFLSVFLFILLTALMLWKYKTLYFPWPVVFLIFLLVLALILTLVNSPVYFSLTGGLWWLMTFGSSAFALIFLLQISYTEKDVKDTLRFYVLAMIVQFPLVIMQYITERDTSPGDWVMGSFPHAHYLGNYLFLWLLALVIPYILGNKRILAFFNLKRSFTLLALLILIFYTDSKTVVGIILLSFLLFVTFARIFKKSLGLHYLSKGKMTFLALSGIFILWLAQLAASVYLNKVLKTEETSVWVFMDAYLSSDLSNQKSRLYQRVYGDMLNEYPVQWLTGTGPGTFASRAANTIAYDVLYKDDQKIPEFIPPASSDYTRKYMSDLWTEEIFLNIGIRSAMLSFPFAGIISLKSELGWLGLLLYLIFASGMAWVLLSRTSHLPEALRPWWLSVGLYWIFLILLMFFDNYQEQSVTMFPLVALSAMMLGFRPVLIKNTNESTPDK